MTFTKWLDTFIEEKCIDLDCGIEVDGPSGRNYMSAQIVIDAIKQAPSHEQSASKKNTSEDRFRERQRYALHQASGKGTGALGRRFF